MFHIEGIVHANRQTDRGKKGKKQTNTDPEKVTRQNEGMTMDRHAARLNEGNLFSSLLRIFTHKKKTGQGLQRFLK